MLTPETQSRTTAFADGSCAECRRPLTGRKTRFCSDRCRMRAVRAAEAQHRRDLLDRLKQAVAEIEGELLGRVGDGD